MPSHPDRVRRLYTGDYAKPSACSTCGSEYFQITVVDDRQRLVCAGCRAPQSTLHLPSDFHAGEQ